MQVYTTKDVAPISRASFRAVVPPSVLLLLRAHARRTAPDECCGILTGRMAGDFADVRAALEAENAADRAKVQFIVPSSAVLAAQRAAERDGLDVIGFYHSHPGGDARPSPADIESAPAGYLYVIVADEEVRAWRRPQPDASLEEVPL